MKGRNIAFLAKMRAEGQARAEKAAQRRVMEEMLRLEASGVYRVDAAVKALAKETGRSEADCRAWVAAQQKKVLEAKAKLEAQFKEVQEKAS